MMDLGRYREYIKGEKRGTPPSTSKQHTPTKYKNIYMENKTARPRVNLSQWENNATTG